MYRRAADTWKSIHRHADAAIEKIATTAVLRARVAIKEETNSEAQRAVYYCQQTCG
jgi:hypothetical protein